MADPVETQNSVEPGDQQPVLPRVETPTAGFLVQLFFVPMVIVTVIVTVWLAFSWLAQRGENPQELVADLERLDKGAWQRAYRLVEELRNPRNTALKNDRDLAQKLAKILERQIDAASMHEQRVWLRMFAARALGHFSVDDGVPALIKAAATQRDPAEVAVRRAALQSLGVLADELGSETLLEQDGLFPALKSASEQFGESGTTEEIREHGQLRSTAAYVMGLVGGEQSLAKLAEMLADAYPDARYNAATGLARQGAARAAQGLLEMLDPNNQAAVEFEDDVAQHEWKRGLVLQNGLRAAGQLAVANPSADVAELRGAIEELLKADVQRSVRLEARQTLQIMNAK